MASSKIKELAVQSLTEKRKQSIWNNNNKKKLGRAARAANSVIVITTIISCLFIITLAN